MSITKQEIFWILRAQSGDHEAFNQLLQTIQTPLYHYIFSLVGEVSLSEDILQEVFIKIYRKLQWLQEVEMFRAWTYRIATREAFKQLKKKRLLQQMGDETLQLPAPALQDEKITELVSYLPQLITHISPASRTVIVLHYLHELSLEEVAEILGIAPGTVKSRLAYGLAGLRNAFQQMGINTK
jgi:RNA polymerase sigma-70 factor (ECF subfamily)